MNFYGNNSSEGYMRKIQTLRTIEPIRIVGKEIDLI
jgi:hypothetical protein